MLPHDLTQELKTRLSTLQGQMGGVLKMLDKENDMGKIIAQFKAVDRGLDVAYNLLLDEVFRKVLALKIVEVAGACPGNCGNENNIEYIRKQFPTLQLEEITRKYKEITQLGEKVREYQKKKSL